MSLKIHSNLKLSSHEVKAAASEAGIKEMLHGAKALAMTVVDLLSSS